MHFCGNLFPGAQAEAQEVCGQPACMLLTQVEAWPRPGAVWSPWEVTVPVAEGAPGSWELEKGGCI